jgi:hypothetical protein
MSVTALMWRDPITGVGPTTGIGATRKQQLVRAASGYGEKLSSDEGWPEPQGGQASKRELGKVASDDVRKS